MIRGNKILLVGCGNMGSALLNGWNGEKMNLKDVSIIDPNLLNEEKESEKRKSFIKAGIELYERLEDTPQDYVPDVVFFAIKPQWMEEALPQYKARNWKETIFISIAAGKTLGFLESHLGEDTAIARAMPNLPALIGNSATVVVPNAHVTDKEKHIADTLLEAVGHVYWVEDEALLDPVTALSGSGPAYVFYFIECLIKVATASGLDEDLAKALAYETVRGSARMAMMSPESVDTWRQRVTSPGGTTEAAMNVLAGENGLEKLLKETMQSAEARSKELAGS